MTPPVAGHDAPRVRVLVADDHPLMLDAIRRRMDEDDDIEIVATAADGEQLLDRYRSHTPDVALVDISMPKLDGIAAARRILEFAPDAKILILSANADTPSVRSAFEAGAVGYLVKTIDAGALAAAVRRAAAGEMVLDQTAADVVVGTVRSRRSQRFGTPLSGREVEVLSLVGDGLKNAQIAQQLFISLETVKTHLDRIYEKLGVHDRMSAVFRGIEEGAIDRPGPSSQA